MNRLARDVGINVVANLIAAAVIYLAGLSAGLLPYSQYLVGASLLLLTVAVCISIILALLTKSETRRGRFTLIGVYASAASIPVTILAFTLVPEFQTAVREQQRELLFPWAAPLFGLTGYLVIVLLVVAIVMAKIYRERKRTFKQRALEERQRHHQTYRNRPGRRKASREPRIIRRQRLHRASGDPPASHVSAVNRRRDRASAVWQQTGR